MPIGRNDAIVDLMLAFGRLGRRDDQARPVDLHAGLDGVAIDDDTGFRGIAQRFAEGEHHLGWRGLKGGAVHGVRRDQGRVGDGGCRRPEQYDQDQGKHTRKTHEPSLSGA